MPPAFTVARPNLVRAWWPATIWIGFICLESTDSFSSDHTGSMMYKLVSHFYPGVNLHAVLLANFILRKTGHFIGYGVLSLLLLRGWRRTLARTRAVWGRAVVGFVDFRRTALLAWLGTIFIAALDEWHQSYIPSRTGTWHDVVLDGSAGLIFLITSYTWLRRPRAAQYGTDSAVSS